VRAVTDPAVFKSLIAHLDNQMLIVTTAVGEERSGCLVGFATQCSINPTRFLVCLSKKNHTYRIAAAGAEVLVVHLPRMADLEVARHFGALTGDEVDKFVGIDWQPGPGGAPVLTGLDWFCGHVHEQHDLGDHMGFVLDVSELGSAARVDEPSLGLGTALSLHFHPGHEP
jgi:flavin reductase (DIM6/NTAB) family NADH-FMN oxidoreductase RutF